MYAQMDDGIYFPQIELLEEFVHGHPNATFFLTFRNMEKWYYSISHWPPRKRGPHKDEQFKMFKITGSPSKEGVSHQEEFDDWYCRHVQRVRNLVSRNPSHTLVEVDIEDPDIGQHMEDLFGIEKSCWGHRNVNAFIHPELDPANVTLSRHTVKKKYTKQTTNRTRERNETIQGRTRFNTYIKRKNETVRETRHTKSKNHTKQKRNRTKERRETIRNKKRFKAEVND